MNYYNRYVRSILQRGETGVPRGLLVKFSINQTFATKTGVTYRRLHDNPLIGFMEGLQFMAGIGDIPQIARIAPNAHLEMFSDMSIYGPRAGAQIEDVISELKEDPYSRRAVITLPARDEGLALRPCTTSLQFIISRSLGMTTIVSMRSSDAVYGLPYDLIQFSMVAKMVAKCVGTMDSNLVVNIGNAHIYDSTLHLAKDYKPWTFELPDIGNTYKECKEWAESEIPFLSMDHARVRYNFHLANSDEKSGI